MYTILQNEVSASERRIPFTLIETSTLAVKANVNFVHQGDGCLKLTKNGGTPTTVAGSVIEVSGTMSGLYYYQCTQAETDTPGWLTIYINQVSSLSQFPTAHIVRAIETSGGVIEAKVVAMSAGVITTNTFQDNTFTSAKFAEAIPANMKKINSVTVSGVGSAANPWGAA